MRCQYIFIRNFESFIKLILSLTNFDLKFWFKIFQLYSAVFHMQEISSSNYNIIKNINLLESH